MYQSVSSPVPPVIAFLTDFGTSDNYVGVMKGVALGIVPHAQLVDITHAIAPQDITAGAWMLATSYRYFPAGTVFTCVVDPGVGSKRRAIALRAGDWVFVGPDNGLFHTVIAEQPVHEVVALTNPAYRRSEVSATFQGRDIFTPAAAHIASGVPLSELGPALAVEDLERGQVAVASRQGEQIVGAVAHVDHYGNLVTNIPLSMVPDLFTGPGVQLGFPARGIVITERRRFFSDEAREGAEDVQPFVYVDSTGYLAIAIRNGNAAHTLGVRTDEGVTFMLTQG